MITTPVYVCFLLFLSSDVASLGDDRRLYSELNPDCNDSSTCGPESNVTLLYIRAEGNDDTLHYLITSLDRLTITITRTFKNSMLHIDWSKFLSPNPNGAVSFSSPAIEQFSIVVLNIWEFNDTGDFNTAVSPAIIHHSLNDFTWNISLTNASEATCASFNALMLNDVTVNKTAVEIQVCVFGCLSSDGSAPRLLHSVESFQIRYTLAHFPVHFTQSRMGLGMSLVSDDEGSELKIEQHVTNDDEYSPGIFKFIDGKLVNNQSESHGFIQWKPVVYTTNEYAVEDSVDLPFSALTLNRSDDVSNYTSALVMAVFGNETSFASLNVMFSDKQENVYQETNYTTWIMTAGLGDPPREQYSLIIIIVTIVGLGLPAIMTIFGIAFRFIQRWRHRDDELMLSRERLIN